MRPVGAGGDTGARRLLQLALALLAALLLASCAALPQPGRPRLAVVFIVDGLPFRQLEQLRGEFAPDGLRRFLERGASFTEAHYGHAYTVTAAGHATLLTGASPSQHGIIGNGWRDPATGAPVYCTGDPLERYIGHPTEPDAGTSPRHLRVQTVGDALRRAEPRAKVLAVSGKDRGAILPAGHGGIAYMAMGDSGRFASSTYYMAAHPAWVAAFRPPAQQDDAALRLDANTLAFALATVAGEGLGQDAVPDLLVVSLSGLDRVNHAHSAESPQSRAHLLQLDRLLQEFLQALDTTVGAGRYVALLSADHGFMPLPSGRLAGSKVLAEVNAALEQRFGAGPLARLSGASLLLDRRLLAQRGLAVDAVAAVAREALLAQPGFAAAYTRQELLAGGRSAEPFFTAARRSWHPEVSGDVQYVLQPGWMFGSAPATHGSPYRYDTHVPLLLWGPAWVRPGTSAQRVDVVDFAPTLARLLGVVPPATSEGRPLPALR